MSAGGARRPVRRWLPPLCAALLALPAWALDSVALVIGERGGYYDEFVDAFTAAAASQRPPLRVNVLAGSERPADGVLAAAEALVPVGSQAMRSAAGWPGVPPIYNALVPKATYERVVVESGRPRTRAGLSLFSALWLDQPPGRLIGLFRQAVPGGRRLGVVLGPDSAATLPRLRTAGTRAGIEVVAEEISRESDLIPALNRLLPQVDALLALPDRVAYTRETIRPVLLTTYRHQKPLLGFSQGYVNAGALAAVFSAPAQMARQMVETLRALPAGRSALPLPQYPAQFAVAINRQVARSLGIDPPPEALVRDALERLAEEEP